MNFKKMAKHFWTLSKHHEGFTLVELIVVIAIMAILAGVAVPAYTGYINKANKASDLQLLGAINTAFAAAAMENMGGVQNVSAATLSYGGTDGAKTVTGVATVNGVANTDFIESFARYFGANTSTVLKAISSFVFDAGKHVFVDIDSEGSVTVSYGGGTITVSAEVAKKLSESTFGEMGSVTLLGQVGYVSDIATALLNVGDGPLFDIVYGNDAQYAVDLRESLGLSDEDMQELMASDGFDMNKFLANSLVLNVAQNSQSIDTNTITDGLADGSLADKLYTDVTSGDAATAQNGLAQAALAYGMYTSYLYKTTGENTTISNMRDLQAALKTPEFQAYVEKPEAQADLQAYMEALNVVNSSTQSPEAATSVLVNGFTDPELVALLGSIMGK